MKVLGLVIGLCLCLVAMPCCAQPINHFTEDEDLGNNQHQAIVMAYPKYYRNDNNDFEEVNTNIESCPDPNWDWQVVKGVYKLRAKNDGTYEINHLGDIFSLKLLGLGFFNSDTKERIVKTNISLSNPNVNANEISWGLPLGCSYELKYIHDAFKDVLIFSQQAKVWLKNNKPSGWTAQNIWVGLIYDCDLSQSNMIESKDFETEESVNFKLNGKVKHRLRKAFVKHELYDPSNPQDKIWIKKKFYRNGKYVEAIPVATLDSEDGGIIFNTTTTFQQGVLPDAGYSGCTDSWINGRSGYENNNYGANENFYVTQYADTLNYRGIIKFDISSIGSGVTVSAAAILLYVYDSERNNAANCSMHEVYQDWVESEVTWNEYSSGNNWGTAGCNNTTTDRNADAEDTVELPALPDDWYTWDFTNLSSIEEWATTDANNEGVLFFAPAGTIGTHTVRSSEYTTDTSERPKMSVTYTAVAAAVANGAFFWIF